MNNRDNAPDENSPLPEVRRASIRRKLGEVIDHLTADVDRVNDPNFRSLLEVSTEVLKGVRTAYAHYDESRGKALPFTPFTD